MGRKRGREGWREIRVVREKIPRNEATKGLIERWSKERKQ